MHLIAATLRGVVTLLHDIRLRDVMHFRRLVEHFVILLEVLRERLLVWVLALALHEQAVLLRGIYELVLVDRSGPLLRVKSRSTTARCSRTSTSSAASASE